jgi:hypothetical protein
MVADGPAAQSTSMMRRTSLAVVALAGVTSGFIAPSSTTTTTRARRRNWSELCSTPATSASPDTIAKESIAVPSDWRSQVLSDN